jgi:hypothetical protein
MIRGDPWKVKVNIRWNWVITCSGWMPLSSFLVANILGYPRFADKSKSAGRTSCLLRTSFHPTHFIEFLTSIYSVVLGSLLAPQTWQNGTHFKAAISQYSSWELGGKRSVRNTDGDGSKPFFYPQDWVLPWFFLQRIQIVHIKSETKNWDTQAVGRRGFSNWFSLKNCLGTYKCTDVPRW